MKNNKRKVVVIGGGTGIHPVLRGLKAHADSIAITAIITMADSGGSTGRLRDEFGRLPVGDVRMALAALSADIAEHDRLLRELFLYRFDKGNGLSGHNFGNLLLIALTELLGSEAAAVKSASQILRIKGTVLPVTEDYLHIVAEYEDGVVLDNEHAIDEPTEDRFDKKIVSLTTQPAGVITTEAKQAIAEADLILLGPGDLYTSLLANCVVGGVAEALKASPATFVYAANLMTEPAQTDSMTVADHYHEVVKYAGRAPDVVIVNTGDIPAYLLEKYAANHQYPVIDDADTIPCRVVREDLLSLEVVAQTPGDALQRSLVRGDAEKMATVIIGLIE